MEYYINPEIRLYLETASVGELIAIKRYCASLSSCKKKEDEARRCSIKVSRNKISDLSEPRIGWRNPANNFKVLMAQDWSDLFKGSGEKKYYVYYHWVPEFKFMLKVGDDFSIPLKPFYVGKGTGPRKDSLQRSRFHSEKLNKTLKDYPIEDVSCIFMDGLTEPEAMEIESKLIYFYGCSNGTHRPLSLQKRGTMFNNRYEPAPEGFVKHLRKI